MDHCKYSFNRCCEHVVLKVDVLETGKMGKHEDLSEFDKGQIVMPRRLGQSISCSDPCSELQLLLVVPSLQWSVSIRIGPRKKQWWTGNRVVGGQGSLMHVGSEGWPVWSDPTDELLMLKLLSNLMLVQIERLQNTKCITVCCVWDHGAMEGGGLVRWIMSDKQVRSMEAPPRYLQDLKDLLLTSWCQILGVVNLPNF